MYPDLKKIYLLDGMKKDIAEYVDKFPNCLQVMAKHLKPGSLTQIFEVPNWKYKAINMASWLVFRELGDNMSPYGLLWTG